MVRETQVGTGHRSVCLLSVSVHTVYRVLSPDGYGDMLVKAWQDVRQFSLIKVSCNHKKSLRVLGLEFTDVVM